MHSSGSGDLTGTQIPGNRFSADRGQVRGTRHGPPIDPGPRRHVSGYDGVSGTHRSQAGNAIRGHSGIAAESFAAITEPHIILSDGFSRLNAGRAQVRLTLLRPGSRSSESSCRQ